MAKRRQKITTTRGRAVRSLSRFTARALSQSAMSTRQTIPATNSWQIEPAEAASLQGARASNCTGEDLHGYTDQPPTTYDQHRCGVQIAVQDDAANRYEGRESGEKCAGGAEPLDPLCSWLGLVKGGVGLCDGGSFRREVDAQIETNSAIGHQGEDCYRQGKQRNVRRRRPHRNKQATGCSRHREPHPLEDVGKSACAGTNSHCLAFPRWTDGTLSIFSTKAKLRKAILLLRLVRRSPRCA